MLKKLLKEQKVDIFTAKIIKKTEPEKLESIDCSLNQQLIIEQDGKVIGIVFYKEDFEYNYISTHLIGNTENRVFEKYEEKEIPDEIRQIYENSLFTIYSPIEPREEKYIGNIFTIGNVKKPNELVLQTL